MNELQELQPALPPAQVKWDIRRRADVIALAVKGAGNVMSIFTLSPQEANDVGVALIYLASSE